MSPLAFILSLPIRLYRLVVSPMLPLNACRFHPSCSQYALDALREHGAFKGLFLAGYRILRCNPFHPGGVDNVPPRRGSSPEARV